MQRLTLADSIVTMKNNRVMQTLTDHFEIASLRKPPDTAIEQLARVTVLDTIPCFDFGHLLGQGSRRGGREKNDAWGKEQCRLGEPNE